MKIWKNSKIAENVNNSHFLLPNTCCRFEVTNNSIEWVISKTEMLMMWKVPTGNPIFTIQSEFGWMKNIDQRTSELLIWWTNHFFVHFDINSQKDNVLKDELNCAACPGFTKLFKMIFFWFSVTFALHSLDLFFELFCNIETESLRLFIKLLTTKCSRLVDHQWW